MNSPVISIGLPVYNGQNYLAHAIESLLAQDLTDFELFITDNGSSDDSVPIAKAFAQNDKRITVHTVDKNVGAAENFNLAFQRTRGEYFKWASHDDMCESEFLSQTLSFLQSNEDYVVAHTQTLQIDDNNVVTGCYGTEPSVDDDSCSNRFSTMINSAHVCFSVFGLIRRSILIQTPLIGAYVGSDRNLLAELALLGKLGTVSKPLFKRRDHPDASIRKFRNENRRLQWFDPELNPDKHQPTVRRLREYQQSIERATISKADKKRCMEILRRWSRRGIHHTGVPVANLLAAEQGRSPSIKKPVRPPTNRS